MPDFNSTQSQLASARTALDQAQLAAMQAKQQSRAAQFAVDQATRQQSSQDPTQAQNLAGLAAAVKQAVANEATAVNELTQSRASLSAVSAQFAAFTDPRHGVEQLTNGSPFLLFPVRIETRFRTINSSAKPDLATAAQQHQLWLRIYPDDCSIDTFEPMLSAAELSNVKNYWMNMWRAGGVENDERGAWSGLVTAQGSGRANWLVDNFQPTNLPAKPIKTNATDEILVIPSSIALATADASAVSSYWQAMWLADGNAAAGLAATATLNAAVGTTQANNLIENYAPFNISDTPAAPLTKSGVKLSLAFVMFPPDPITTLQSWSQAPQVRQFPDRFVVLGFSGGQQTLEAVGSPVTLPLYVGPDPSNDPNEGIHPNGPDLFIPTELQWMVDFESAVTAGMALAIDLTPQQAAAGFDRLLVLGLQMSVSEQQGPAALQELLAHHLSSRSGFAFLPQGTPAHNSSGADSGSDQDQDADASFNDRKNRPLFTSVPDPMQKQDGQWFAELLGLDPAFIANVHASGGIDQKQARAMQTALWPATLGYWMQTLFTPNPGVTSIFSDADIDETRSFFSNYVSGRGALPAIRIGGQPYGILPTTVFSRIQWFAPDRTVNRAPAAQRFLSGLYGILRQLDSDWITMSQSAAWVGESGTPPPDPHQLLLDVLALNPSSVEYYSRTAESALQLYNMLAFYVLAPAYWQAIETLLLQAQPIALLSRLGYSGKELPDLLSHFFLKESPQITTVIDDVALSETNPIRAYTDDSRNYIQWMIDGLGSSLDVVRQESGFTGGKSPQALLYLYLRQAVMLGYYDSSYRYHANAGFLTPDALRQMRVEPNFIHIADAPGTSESRFAALYKTESRITGSPSLLVSDFIREQIKIAPETIVLSGQLDSLETLVSASTAQLERLFAEHIDICSYRYDAWMLGLVSQQLSGLRASSANQKGAPGLYLGAYAWVENLQPSADKLSPAQLPAALASQFSADEPLMSDTQNGGYIHAPSLQHADAAAVLRAGFLSAKATGGDSGALAVNLSSDRVRVALTLIEGIRNGQSLGALLGYQFETGLHDDYSLAEVDQFIYPLRKAFPLVADAMASTRTDATVPIEAIEASNVLDGKKLLDQTKAGGATYPYGLTTLPPASAAQLQALNAQTQALLNAYDAVADLALSEGVYQAVQGNYDRVASTMAAYTTGNFPPEPEVVQMKPPGITLTHRFALQLKPGLAMSASASPRVQTEPAIDRWLGGVLPPLNQVGCTIQWKDPINGVLQSHAMTLADLNLSPLDLLFLLKPDNVQAMAELDDRIYRYAVATWAPRPDAAIAILYMTAGAGLLSVFEVGPLLRQLRTLLLQSRPLRATDVMTAGNAQQQDNVSVFADPARVTTPLTSLQTLGTDIQNFLAVLSPLLADTLANRGTILANVDGYLNNAVTLLERASRFSLPSTGWGFAYAWLQLAFSDLLAQVSALVTRWNQKLTAFQTALSNYDALPAGTSDSSRFSALQAAELLISSQLDPLPPLPATLRAALDVKATNFENRLNQFSALADSTAASFLNLFNSVTALSTEEFDSQPFDVSPIGDRAIVVTEDIYRALASQLATLNSRTTATQAQVTIYNTSASAATQVQALQAAAKALFGEDFQMVPEFKISAAQAGEWSNAVNASLSGDLFTYLKTDLNIDFPVDEWLYGAARVRSVVHSWETVIMLSAAFGVTLPQVTPIQLPFASGDPWLALSYPSDYVIDSDRLLYTSIDSEPFDPTAHQCGLMLDEWSEVIPSSTRDTAITFNYARPDNEPPQNMLLIVSPAKPGSWQWADLVDALNETLDLAKKRAVEPAFLDSTVYSRFLPATVMASAPYGINIATALTSANGVIELLEGEKHA